MVASSTHHMEKMSRQILMKTNRSQPRIIQGGMGVAVSSWKLVQAVAKEGQLGVLSGTGLETVLARRLQLGDLDGSIRRALDVFPNHEIAERIYERYHIPGGKSPEASFIPIPPNKLEMTREAVELVVVANFVEVYLAKEDHDGLVGINYLEKIQLPTLPSIFGAMLAGVDYILMGAGIPRTIPGILDRLCEGKPVELPLYVQGAGPKDSFVSHFDPASLFEEGVPWLERPRFLAIVSSSTLATMLVRKSNGYVDGFVVEGPTAGGHNAPPRGKMTCNDRGEPIYGDRDIPDLEVFRSLGRPFWLAGSYGSPERMVEAIRAGAVGIQVGTPFAFCEESGLDPQVKRHALDMSRQKKCEVLTDPLASPTGFPFKVLAVPGSLSEEGVDCHRRRICDLGHLRQAYKRDDGSLGWRCPAEPIENYLKKGGKVGETVGRKCLCNSLMANVSLGQVRPDGYEEKMLVTCGDEVGQVTKFLSSPEAESYSAQEVIENLLSGIPGPEVVAT